MSAEVQNRILFEKMAKKMIEGTFESFRDAAGLLTTWLSKRQAYYPDALLQIVRLLFIAQLRVRNEVSFDLPALLFQAEQYNDNPFATTYITLVNAIVPFEDIFLESQEKGLREGYQQLIASVAAVSAVPTDPTEDESLNSRLPTALSIEPTNEPIEGQQESNDHVGAASTDSSQIEFPPANVDMNVIALQHGLKTSFRIFLQFEISSEQFESVRKWTRRQGDAVELKSCVCISLGCYLLADLKEQFDTGQLSSFEQQVSCTPCKWPNQRGSLSLRIISAELKEENLPLSPPFHVTPNNLLDISELVAEGNNKLHLLQTTDLSHVMFVLHAHHPTMQQLEQVQEHMQKKKDWQQFVENVAPFPYDSFRTLLTSKK